MTTMTLDTTLLSPSYPMSNPVSMLPSQQVKEWSDSPRETARRKAKTVDRAAASPSDEDLMLAMRDGSEHALELLYERYARYAFALAYRILHDTVAAEDVVQEAFLSIWRKASSYSAQHGSVLSWLQAIVHHRAIDKVRSSAHRDQQWSPLQAEHEQDPASAEPDVYEQVWYHEQQRLIRNALEQLPAEQRMVIELAYFKGYTHAEIAERYHIPLGTVKGRMRLGLQKMKLNLQERGIQSR